MSLLGVLNNYNRGNYKLNPVIVQEEDYNVYYGGISNGLLWPALHNLPEYIVGDYDDPKVNLWIVSNCKAKPREFDFRYCVTTGALTFESTINSPSTL